MIKSYSITKRVYIWTAMTISILTIIVIIFSSIREYQLKQLEYERDLNAITSLLGNQLRLSYDDILISKGALDKLAKKYLIQPDSFIWSNVALDELRIKMLRDYLDNNHLLSEAKLKLLIELLYKKAQGTKSTGIIGVGVFLSFIIPIWSQFIAWLYKNPLTLDEALKIAGTFTIALLGVFITLYMLQTMVKDIIDRKRETMRGLAGMLEQILLML